MRKNKSIWIVPALAGAILLFSCKKHHPNPTNAPQTNLWDETTYWNALVGHYKVYDSIGDFIYEMDISRITANGNDNVAKFANFNGEFTFTASRSYNYPTYVNLWLQDTLFDTSNKRWTLTGYSASPYYNNMHGDTIPLRFHLSNIKFWMYDIAPYYSAEIKQIAVKQP